jgi:hypothetical protein
MYRVWNKVAVILYRVQVLVDVCCSMLEELARERHNLLI